MNSTFPAQSQKNIPLRERSSNELILRIKKGNILHDQEIREIVATSQTATSVYNLVVETTGSQTKGQAARCLFFLREKNFEEYQKLVTRSALSPKTEVNHEK